MLRLLFFVMTYLTDYRTAADVLRSGFALGLGNAVVLGLVGGWMAIRAWWMSRYRLGFGGEYVK
jgi:hypothetical protein